MVSCDASTSTWCGGPAESSNGSGRSNERNDGGPRSSKENPACSHTGHGCPSSNRSDEKSGMTGDCHVPFCGSPGGRSPGASRRVCTAKHWCGRDVGGSGMARKRSPLMVQVLLFLLGAACSPAHGLSSTMTPVSADRGSRRKERARFGFCRGQRQFHLTMIKKLRPKGLVRQCSTVRQPSAQAAGLFPLPPRPPCRIPRRHR